MCVGIYILVQPSLENTISMVHIDRMEEQQKMDKHPILLKYNMQNRGSQIQGYKDSSSQVLEGIKKHP